MNFRNKIFSIKKTGIYKIITILGIKFRFVRHRRIEQLFSMGINKEKISSQVENFKELGINKEKTKSPRLIVSLTSYPARMYEIHYCLYSLLTQTKKPDEVILWLSYEQFPNKEDDVPIKILNLKKNGLTIKWCKNYKAHTKLVPALLEYPNDIIVTADDDIFYDSNWLEKLYNEYLTGNRKTIYAHRCHRVVIKNKKTIPYKKWKKSILTAEESFLNFATGVGGVLYPPKSLHEDVIDDKKFSLLSPNNDDIWFWAMALLNNTKIKTVSDPYKLIYINPQRELGLNNETTLLQTNQYQNDQQIQNVIKEYPEILNILENQ